MKANNTPEAYPIQFRDKIDEYLWKEHHIIGGGCSSIESLKYSVAREVAERLIDVFIEKGCDWFRRIDYDDSMPPFETTEEFIEGFRKYMKGE